MEEESVAENSPEPAAEVAAGYETIGGALELGSVVLSGVSDPAAHVRLPLATLSRHALVTGALGSGRTRTLQVVAEQLSAAGIPVVVADPTSHLSGLSSAGEPDDAAITRAGDTGDEMWTPRGNPALFYSIGTAGAGVPVRATVTSFGPMLLARALRLDEDAENTLGRVFAAADEAGTVLLDLADLRREIEARAGRDEERTRLLGRIADLERSAAGTMFGEPELDVADLVRRVGGRGVINLFGDGADIVPPALYSAFVMWTMATVHRVLPAVDDLDPPALVFVVDEAHLLFDDDASDRLAGEVADALRAFPARGVGVVLCARRPDDLPREVLDRLEIRIQHAPEKGDEQVTLDEAKRVYPPTEIYDLERILGQLGTGEALVTAPSELGEPTPIAWTRIRAPQSRIGTVGEEAMRAFAQASPLYGKYGRDIDRDSAYDKLTASTLGDTAAPGVVERGMFGVALRRNRPMPLPD